MPAPGRSLTPKLPQEIARAALPDARRAVPKGRGTGGGGALGADPLPSSPSLVINTKFAVGAPSGHISNSLAVSGETGLSGSSREAKYLLQETSRSLLPGHRVCSCFWWLARGATDVGVNYSAAENRASYSRLMVCGSVWACPICAARITEQRAEEVRSGLAALLDRGGSAAFATFTVSHSHEDALQTVLAGFLAAFRYLTGKTAYRALRGRYGVLGFVRVLEVTYGRNGWHVHSHVLYFLDQPLSADQLAALEDALYPLWESAAARQGLSMSRRYGLEVKRAYGSVEDYLVKYGRGPRWDMARELTKGHIKRGRSIAGLKHLTPWELLAAAAAGDARCGRLFAEFVDRFDGKAQLWWSPGLRALLLGDAAEVSDADLAATLPVESVEVGAIASALW